MVVRSQPRQIGHQTLSWKNSSQKRTAGVAQGVGPEFKSQYKKNELNINTSNFNPTLKFIPVPLSQPISNFYFSVLLFFGNSRVWTQGLTLARQPLFCFRFFVLFLLFVELEFELRASCLLGRRSTTCYSDSSFFCSTGVWTQGLHLESLHQSFFVKGFFKRGSQTTCLSWLQTTILLISASLAARITGMSHQHMALCYGVSTHLNFLSGLSPNLNLPDLCLLSSWD
jgi:hypothetical protein